MKNYKYILGHSGSTPTTLTLTHSPVGWDEAEITLLRNETYHSVLRNFAIQLRFVREGMNYIEGAYNADGINAVVTIEIQYLDKSDYTYNSLYTGILDFTKYKKARDFVEIPIIDNDTLSKFKTRDEIELSLAATKSIDGTSISLIDTQNFTIEGVEIREQIKAPFVSSTASTPNDTQPAIVLDRLVEEIEWNTTDDDYTNDSGGDETIEYTCEATIAWDLTFPGDGGPVDIFAEIDENGSIKDIASIRVLNAPGNETGTYTDTRTATITIPDGGYLGRMRIRIVSTTSSTGTAYISSGTLTLFKVTSPYEDTQENLILPHEAFKKALEITTGSTDYNSDETGRTDLGYVSDGDLSLIALANGANIRGFTQSQRPLKTSFKDLFKALFSIKPIGFWYNHAQSRFELNEITDFYKDSELIDLGEVSELEILVEEDHYYNDIQHGYFEDLEYEDINGNQVFATKTNYNNNVQRIKRSLDLTCSFRSDDYGIELTRKYQKINYYSKSIDADQDNFMIFGQRSGSDYITVQGYDNFTTITMQGSGQLNIYTPETRLNLDLSPKRCMLRHTMLLSAPVYMTTGPVQFLNSQFNFDLGLQKSGEASVIYESDDIDNSAMDEPLFYPEIYTFEKEISASIINTLLADPHGYITFDYEGTTYKGFILEVNINPFKRLTTWKLIKYNPNR